MHSQVTICIGFQCPVYSCSNINEKLLDCVVNSTISKQFASYRKYVALRTVFVGIRQRFQVGLFDNKNRHISHAGFEINLFKH
jgi:hypothetical protein